MPTGDSAHTTSRRDPVPEAALSPPAGPSPVADASPVAGELPAVPLVLYDGNCGLCARSIRWILDHERDHEIMFAPLQGPTAAVARRLHPRIPQSVDSVVYIADGRAHLRSKAMLHAARHLRAPWRWGYAIRWVPGLAFDLGYRLVAAMRYRIWGHADACRMVTPEQRTRFLP